VAHYGAGTTAALGILGHGSPERAARRPQRQADAYPGFGRQVLPCLELVTTVATLAEFRLLQKATTSPPAPGDSWLGEAIVHGEDIRRPLRIRHEYPLPTVIQALEFYSRSNALIGGKKRIAGLTLKATDAVGRTAPGRWSRVRPLPCCSPRPGAESPWGAEPRSPLTGKPAAVVPCSGPRYGWV